MVKFKFNYFEQTLAYQKPYHEEYWYEIAEQFQGNFGSLGFQLTEGWITFTVYANKIRVFFKHMSVPLDLNDFWEPQTVTYFRKDLPKQVPIIFEFTSADEVEKLGNAWVKKNQVLSKTKGAPM
jgi:hypothetical protein